MVYLTEVARRYRGA